jgi:hypothetical protein
MMDKIEMMMKKKAKKKAAPKANPFAKKAIDAKKKTKKSSY